MVKKVLNGRLGPPTFFHPHPSFEGAALKSHLPRKREGKQVKSRFGTIAKR